MEQQGNNTNDLAKEPVQLLELDQGTWKVLEGAKRILRALPGPVRVIAVAGPMRTGKSFLLNRLANQQKGFAIGGETRGCTKGLWIWGLPQKDPASDCWTIFLDTEGLYDPEPERRDPNSDAQIFCITILLASYLIYNTQSRIDETALRSLGCCVNIAEHIRRKSVEQEDGIGLSDYFPSLTWVLRDFFLKIEDDLSPTAYMEKQLSIQPGRTAEIRSANEVRDSIRAYFPKRECFTLPFPVRMNGDERNDERLRNVEKEEYSSLLEPFRKKMEALTQKVLKEAPAKKIWSTSSDNPNNIIRVTGSGLCDFAELIVNAINSGQAPCIEDMWIGACRASCAQGVTNALAAVEKHAEGLLARLPLSLQDLSKEKAEITAVALKEFVRLAAGPKVEEEKERLLARFDERWLALGAKNREVSEERCREIANELFGAVKNTTFSKFDEFCEARAAAKQAFLEQTNSKGPAQDGIMEELTERFKALSDQMQLQFDLDEQRVEMEKQQSEFEARQLEMERLAAEQREREERLKADIQREQLAREAQKLEMERKIHEQDELFEERKRAQDAEIRRLREEGQEQLANMQQEMSLKVEEARRVARAEAQQQLCGLQEQLHVVNDKMKQISEEAAKERREHAARMEEMQRNHRQAMEKKNAERAQPCRPVRGPIGVIVAHTPFGPRIVGYL